MFPIFSKRNVNRGIWTVLQKQVFKTNASKAVVPKQFLARQLCKDALFRKCTLQIAIVSFSKIKNCILSLNQFTGKSSKTVIHFFFATLVKIKIELCVTGQSDITNPDFNNRATENINGKCKIKII